MTKYCYADEMYLLCFKVSQVLIVLKDKDLSQFYHNAIEGFYIKQRKMTLKEAVEPATEENLKDLAELKKFHQEKVKLACQELEKEAV